MYNIQLAFISLMDEEWDHTLTDDTYSPDQRFIQTQVHESGYMSAFNHFYEMFFFQGGRTG